MTLAFVPNISYAKLKFPLGKIETELLLLHYLHSSPDLCSHRKVSSEL